MFLFLSTDNTEMCRRKIISWSLILKRSIIFYKYVIEIGLLFCFLLLVINKIYKMESERQHLEMTSKNYNAVQLTLLD